MGVPKFYRYMSERYPCLSEFVKEYQIPPFDNLYLDMNGIIHQCSHPDDGNPHFRISEARLFADIFHYIEALFQMIKPRKVFFMAVDGVAPRAKMNQQRGRRFCSAKDAERSRAEALKKGEKLPATAPFDSNCITPGTVFMARLHEQLQYFVVNKISNDRLWKSCKVILSGHETPGEGEHKIMDYIRYSRAQPGYDPNTRHCLYGLDADLIMLGLCTHEPHFCLLREEVKFGKTSSKRSNVPEEMRFYLLHLSLMREYLELEFAPLKNKLTGFDYNIENIIDDWVLMGFLVGNDFIPHLPNLHIVNGALPVLYKAYMNVLPTLDGYINESGTLNLVRFEMFMKRLSEIDVESFEEYRDDLLYMEAKTGRKANTFTPTKCKDPKLAELIQEADELCLSDEASDEGEDEETTDEDGASFENYKKDYYRNKLDYQNVTPEVMRDQAEGYVRAIQWNLHYYYNGVCSWSWYYPHHYAPYISDIKGFTNFQIDFDLGRPFKPFEQLLAVLPAASKDLLPTCYHSLMTDDESIIKEYYPEDFETDLNGKRQPWEAVVLVPFIDEKRLLSAMGPCNKQLTADEIKRNSHGPMLIYNYTSISLGLYESPGHFPNVTKNYAQCERVFCDDIRVARDKLIKGAYPGVLMDVFYPGFPTMKHLKYKGDLKNAKIKVFDNPSRNESMIITVLPSELYMDDQIPVDLLGQNVFVGWPHLIEARVVGMFNSKKKYTLDEKNKSPIVEEPGDDFYRSLLKSSLEGIHEHWYNRMGVSYGETNVIVQVKQLVGRKYIFTANGQLSLEKQFAIAQSSFPLQGIVVGIKNHDDFHSTYRNVEELFTVDSTCFILTNPHYGARGTVLDSTETLKDGRFKVSVSVEEEPDFTAAKSIEDVTKKSYFNSYTSANHLSISNYVFSRITGSIFIGSSSNLDPHARSINVGLDLKFNKRNQEIPGYTKRIDKAWFYTDKAIDLVRNYFDLFPEIFITLSQSKYSDELDSASIFGDNCDAKMKELQEWLKQLPTSNIERRVCNSSTLERAVVDEIEQIVDGYYASKHDQTTKTIVMNIRPQHLYKPEIQSGLLAPDPTVETRIFDRVVNVRESFTVPFGLKGTVIAVCKSQYALNDDDVIYEIVFDQSFAGGLALNCSTGRGYRLPRTSFINLSHGKRLIEQKTGRPGELLVMAKASRNIRMIANDDQQKQNSAFASFTNNNNGGNNNNNSSRHANSKWGFAKNTPTRTQYPNYLVNLPQQQQQQVQPKLRPVVNQPQYQQQQQSNNLINSIVRGNNNNTSNNNNNNKGNFHNDFMPGFGQWTQPRQSYDNRLMNPDAPQHSKTVVVADTAKEPSVNTEFLKKILKIDSSDNSSRASTTNRLTSNDTTLSASSKKSTNTKVVEQEKDVKINNNHKSSSTNPQQQQQSNILSFDMFSKAVNTNATTKLLVYYQSNALGCPRYTYFENKPGSYAAQLILPNNRHIIGREAKSREEASENVAEQALNIFTHKEVAPQQMFPSPPQNWVQRGYPPHINNIKSPTKNADKFNKTLIVKNSMGLNQQQQQRRHPNENPLTTNSFVPLQAIKKQQQKTRMASSNKNANNSTASTSGNAINNKKWSNETIQTVSSSSGMMSTTPNTVVPKEHIIQHQPHVSGDNNKSSARQRRTRIAANFVARQQQ